MVPFFCDVLRELQEQNIADYRLKITSTENSFEFRVSHNKPNKHGPHTFDYCLSCDPDRARICDNNYPGGECAVAASATTPTMSLPEALRALTSADCEWGVHCWVILIQPTTTLFASGSMHKLDL